jgi:hypothetical protein
MMKRQKWSFASDAAIRKRRAMTIRLILWTVLAVAIVTALVLAAAHVLKLPVLQTPR